MSDLIFSISGDTANGLVEPTTLSGEIIASGLAPALKIETIGDVLTINHTPDLSIPDSGTLVGVVAAHSGIDFSTVDHPGPTGDIIQEAIDVHAGDPSAHHVRYTDAEAIAASSGALDHHFRYTDAEASGVAVQVATTGISNHAADSSAHHTRYTDAEAIAASSGALDHHFRYTDAEASGVAVQVTTSGISNHVAITDAHHSRYTDAEAIAASSGALDHHFRYTDAEASGVAVQVTTSGIANHSAISDAHHIRYTDAEAIAASSGALDHHVRYTDAEASGVAVQVATTGIANHAAITDAHHTRYTDAEAIAASSGALDHHQRYTDAEASGIAVQVATTGIADHAAISDAHHARYTDAEAIAASSGALDHHVRYTDAEASGVAVQVATTGIANHAAITDAHHTRYTDAEAIAASSGALDHHVRYTDTEASGVAVQVAITGIANHAAITDAHHTRYTDAEASGVAVQVATSGIEEAITNHTAVTDAHHTRYTDTEAIAAASGALDHHARYTDAEASGVVGTLSIDELIDVDTTTSPPGLENSLVWDGTNWAPSGIVNGGGVGFTSFKYRYRTDTADADPGNGRLRFNNTNLQIATQSYIDAQDSDGTVLTNILSIPASGDILILQSVNDASEWWAYDILASGEQVGDINTGYTRFPNLSIRASGLSTSLFNNTNVVLGFIFIANRGVASLALDDLTDVVAPSPSVEDALVYDGTDWVPSGIHPRYTDAEAIVAATGAVTLQTAYDVSPSVPQIHTHTNPVTIRDAATPLSSVFDVQNNAGTIDLLSVQGNVGGTQVELGAHDSLISGSNEPIIRIGDNASSMEFWPTDRIFTSTAGSLMIFNGTYEYDYANNSFAALNLQATIEIRQSQFVLNGFLLFNNGLTIKNINGVAANLGPGQTFIAQPTIQADGAAISMGQNRDFLSQPRFNTVAGGTLTVGTWTGLQLLGQINTGVTMTTRNAIQIGAMIGAGGTLTNERGIRIENLAGRGGSTTIVGIQSALIGTTKKFIEQLGTSPSTFAGDIHMNNGISLVLGTQAGNRVELLRSAAGTMRMIGQGGTNNEALEWDFDTATANNVEVNSSTGAGLQFNLDAISFGTTAADPTGANWFTIFSAPNLRTPSVGGEYSDVLWTAGGTLDIDGNTMSNVQGFKINAPAVILNGGTIDDLSNLFVDAMSSFGATRFQALRVRGRTRLDGLITYNHETLATLTADVAALTLPANNNGRHMILMDADASGPWTVQGVVNDQVGDSVYIMNSGVNDFIVGHQDGAAAAGDRIVSPTASGITLSQHQMVKLWYNSTISRWNVLEHTGT